MPNRLRLHPLQHSKEAVLLRKNSVHRGGGVDFEWLELAQQQKSERVVKIAVGEYDGCNRTASALRRFARMEFGSRFDLRSEIRRSVDQAPLVRAKAQGELSLCSTLAVKGTSAQATTVCANAIPLGKSASGGRPENFYLHRFRPDSREGWLRRRTEKCRIVPLGGANKLAGRLVGLKVSRIRADQGFCRAI